MRFSIDAVELQRILHLLQVPAVVNTKDATGRIFIKADADGTCLFLCNNSIKEIHLTVHTGKVVVDEPGETSIVYGELKSFAASIRPWDGETGAKDFCFSETTNDLVITTENVHDNGQTTKAKLKLSKYESYDIRKPKPFGTPTFTLTSDMYKKALNRILYAIDVTEIAENLKGANLIFTEDEIYFAGTNGVKVAEQVIKNVSGLKDTSLRFNYDFIYGLSRLVGAGQQLDFEVDGRDIRVFFDGVVFGSSLIIGREFADYRGQFDKFTKSLILDKEILLENIRPMVDLLDPEDNNRATLSINGEGLVISCDMATFNYAGEVTYEEKIALDFNGRLFFDTVNAINDDKILFKFSSPMGNMVFDSASFEDQKAVLTPLSRR